MKIAVFPGSFDPITLGHYDIIERAVPLFDKLIIAIGQNSDKKYMFPLEKRIEFIKKSVAHFKNVEVDFYEGLTIDYCLKNDAKFILRGLRNPADFEFERAQIAQRHAVSGRQLRDEFVLHRIE